MKFLKNLLIIIGIIIIVLLIGRWYLGGFNKLVAVEKTVPSYIMAYTTFTGNYKDVGPIMNNLYDALSGAGVKFFTGIGIYYDDPAAASGENLRSDVWSIISQEDFDKLDRSSPDYRLKILEWGERVVVEFPYRNSLSYIVWPMKAYPIMNTYIAKKWYILEVPRIEIYDMDAWRIYFMADIVK